MHTRQQPDRQCARIFDRVGREVEQDLTREGVVLRMQRLEPEREAPNVVSGDTRERDAKRLDAIGG